MNAATVIAAAVVAAAVVSALAVMFKDRKNGGVGCGGACRSCPHSEECRKKSKK